jgi:hypothetical protein
VGIREEVEYVVERSPDELLTLEEILGQRMDVSR